MTSSSSDCKSSMQQEANIDSSSMTDESNHTIRDASRFNTIFDHASTEILFLNSSTLSLTAYNKHARVQLGYSDEDIKGVPFDNICSVDDVNFKSSLDDLRLGNVEKCFFYAEFIRKDGSTYPVKLEVLKDTKGEEQGFIILGRDITRRVKQEYMLEKSRDELRLIFDNVPARIWRKDKNNRYLKVNKAAAGQFGLEPKELEGLYPSEVWEGYEESILHLDTEVLNSGEPKLGLEVRAPYDPESWERIDIVPVQSGGRETDGLLVISSDITKQKEAESQLEAAIEELEAANERLEQFNALVSHDLRAPLRHMRMLSELLLLNVEEGSEAHSYATDIHQNAAQGQAMIGALNALSQISRSELNRTELDLSRIVLQIETLLKNELDLIGGKIICGDLPLVKADAELAKSIFQNLIENAIKYRANRPLEIVVSAQHIDGEDVFSVADNGRGINGKYSQEIFQIFTRLSGGDEETPPGQGVGLSICRKIIERHGGKIWLDESYENGACFKFTLSSDD